MILHLNHNFFSGIIPNGIGKLNSLKELGLQSNGFFVTTPEYFGSLEFVKGVRVDNHFLTWKFPA